MHHLPASTDPSRIDLQINLAWALAHYFRFDESRQLLDNLDQMVVNHRDDITPNAWLKLRVVRAICEALPRKSRKAWRLLSRCWLKCPAETPGSTVSYAIF